MLSACWGNMHDFVSGNNFRLAGPQAARSSCSANSSPSYAPANCPPAARAVTPPRIVVLPPLAPGPRVQYVLPLRWSLSYALTKKQWADVRQRHKDMHPDGELCSCPKRCKASSLDEHWDYDESSHTKTFIGAKFICPGCHWLKSPTWRILTWKQQASGQLGPLVKPAHIIECLGWTQAKVDALREHDISRFRAESEALRQLDQQVQAG